MSETQISVEETSLRNEKSQSINKSNNPDTNSKRIIIDSINDLYNLPISVMKNTKLIDFGGKYFEVLFKKTLGLEEKKESQIEMANSAKNLELKRKSKSKKHRKINSNVLGSDKKKKVKSNLSLKINNITKKSLNNNKGIYIVKITFQIKCNTRLGEELFILGSNSALGKWDPKLALKMNWNDNNIWKVSISFKKGVDENFEFKFILSRHGNFNWETGDNRKFILGNIKQLIEKSSDKKNGIVKVNNINNYSYYYDMNNRVLNIICEWNKK